VKALTLTGMSAYSIARRTDLLAREPGRNARTIRSFQAGRFFLGTVLVNADKSMYDALFKRKGLFDNFFGEQLLPARVTMLLHPPSFLPPSPRVSLDLILCASQG
jgi:hypothetical protein